MIIRTKGTFLCKCPMITSTAMEYPSVTLFVSLMHSPLVMLIFMDNVIVITEYKLKYKHPSLNTLHERFGYVLLIFRLLYNTHGIARLFPEKTTKV